MLLGVRNAQEVLCSLRGRTKWPLAERSAIWQKLWQNTFLFAT